MKLSLYQRLALSVFGVFILMAYLLYWWSTSLAEHSQHKAEQKLHLALATHLASDNPLLQHGVYDKTALSNMFHSQMILGPSFEFYFVDPQGKILTYSAPADKIKRQQIDLQPMLALINNPEQLPVYGDDPRNDHRRKIFSAAPVYNGEQLQGYLYVIIGGEIYDSIFSAVHSDQYLLQNTLIASTSLVLLFLLLLGMFRYFTSPIRQLVSDMVQVKKHKFDKNQFTLSQWHQGDSNEIHILGNAFNAMCDQIDSQLQQLSENDRIRRELLAHLSHDLRTPLASMQGYLEILERKTADLTTEQVNQYMATVLRNAKQLKSLIDQIFELAHLEDGQVSVNMETFAIGELLHDIIAKFSIKAESKNVRLQLKPQQCRYLVHSDIAKLERILSNLIENALRHTTAGGQICIEVEQLAEKVKVAVVDTGTGINAKDLAYIFDARYRASNAIGDKRSHVGLGLAISKRLSLILQSDLNVDSELGQGSRFYLSLKTSPA